MGQTGRTFTIANVLNAIPGLTRATLNGWIARGMIEFDRPGQGRARDFTVRDAVMTAIAHHLFETHRLAVATAFSRAGLAAASVGDDGSHEVKYVIFYNVDGDPAAANAYDLADMYQQLAGTLERGASAMVLDLSAIVSAVLTRLGVAKG